MNATHTMKGIVFTEFLEMVEQNYGYAIVDDLITHSSLDSEGAYTAIGTYQHTEMVQLLSRLSTITNTPVPALMKAFGHYLFGTFTKNYPHFFTTAATAFDFLFSIENYIHVEVRKLYPDAQFPRFQTQKLDENTLEMIYNSERRMSDFAEGLLEKTFEHYQEKCSIKKIMMEVSGTKVKFIIKKI
jgi:Haem-NO-binding